MPSHAQLWARPCLENTLREGKAAFDPGHCSESRRRAGLAGPGLHPGPPVGSQGRGSEAPPPGAEGQQCAQPGSSRSAAGAGSIGTPGTPRRFARNSDSRAPRREPIVNPGVGPVVCVSISPPEVPVPTQVSEALL